MATPMTASTIVKILKAEGLKVVEYKDWRDHERDAAAGKPFGPVYGVIMHHTVTSGTQDSVDICYDGYTALPGPLCHGMIAKNGVIYLLSKGRANHAGLGDPDSLAAVQNENYTGTLTPNENSVDGNDSFYGFECENLGNGSDPWPAVQVEAMVKAAAAICRHYGWKAESVIGHKEWQLGKIDPININMASFRDDVQAVIDGGASGPSVPSTPPKPKPVYAPFPGVGFFRLGKRHDLITQMGKALKRAGYKAQYTPTDEFTRADIKAYAWWQRKLGYTGKAADGYPGADSWKKLKVAKPK